MGNLADMQSALVDYIAMQGYAGYASREAANTISGSVASMKAAWTNLVTGLANGNADIGKLVDNLVTTIVGDGTANNLGVLGNVMPAVKRALNGAAKLVEKLFPKIIKEIPEIIEENLPVLAKAAVGIVESLVKGISKNQKKLMKTAIETITYLADSFLKMLPEIVQLGLDIIVSLAEGVSKSLPKLTPTIVNVVLQIVKTLTDPATLTNLLDAALEIVSELAGYLLQDDVLDSLIDSAVQIVVSICEFITQNVGKLFSVATKIIISLLEYLTDPENLGELLSAGVEIIAALANALVVSVDGLASSMAEVIAWIVKAFTGIDLSEQGKEAMASFISGMLEAAIPLVRDLRGVLQALLSNKDEGLVGGLGGASGAISGSHRSGLDYVPYDGYIAELHKGERVLTASEASGYSAGNSFGDIIINIDGAKYSDEQSLASAIALEIQNMTDRRAAVYA
jgi:phage-related protein